MDKPGMPNVVDEARQFAAELKALYEAAGSPPYQRVVSWARQQKFSLGASTLCNWLNGKTTPSDPRVLLFLVQELGRRAAAHPQHPRQPRTPQSWESLRQAAVASRRAQPKEPQPKGPQPKEQDPAAAGSVTEPAAPVRRTRAWLLVTASATVGAVAALAAAYAYLSVIRVAPGGAPSPIPTPAIVAYDGTPAPVRSISGPGSPAAAPWYVADNVSGAGSCPKGWVCFFQYPDFNARKGWMVLAEDQNQDYNFPDQYDHAATSWINNTPAFVHILTSGCSWRSNC
jgi:hypothetical protein